MFFYFKYKLYIIPIEPRRSYILMICTKNRQPTEQYQQQSVFSYTRVDKIEVRWRQNPPKVYMSDINQQIILYPLAQGSTICVKKFAINLRGNFFFIFCTKQSYGNINFVNSEQVYLYGYKGIYKNKEIERKHEIKKKKMNFYTYYIIILYILL